MTSRVAVPQDVPITLLDQHFARYVDRIVDIGITAEDEAFVLQLIKLSSRIWKHGEDAKVAEISPLLSKYLDQPLKRCIITSSGAQNDGGIFTVLDDGQQVVIFFTV